MEAEKVKCLIIGSGPAGYTAAIYAARANLSPVLYEGLQPGGQLTTTTDIENFPGYPEGISGTQMMEDLRKQAERFGADLRFGVATAADLSKSPYKITIDEEKVIEAQTVIIATGAAAPVVQNVDYLLQICRVVVLFIKFQKHDIVGLGLKVYYKSNNKFLEIKCIRMDFILRSAFCGVLPPIAIARLLQPLFRLASKRPRRVREPRHVRALGWWLCPGRLWPLQCFRV